MSQKQDVEFVKYKQRGAYHWKNIALNPNTRNAFVLGRYQNMISLVKKTINNNQDKIKILDIGCGDGVLTYLIQKEFPNAIVHGVDFSELAILLAKEKIKGKRLTIDFRQGSAYELPYLDNSIDVVISSDVIEHLSDTEKYLSEINRVLRTGGGGDHKYSN